MLKRRGVCFPRSPRITNGSSLPLAKRFSTLFEHLLLRLLRDLSTDKHILIVIDALDESGDATGSSGLHKFLANHLHELPSNLRILITSRPENGFEPAFGSASSVPHQAYDRPRPGCRNSGGYLCIR